MSMEEDIKLLDEYNSWVAERKRSANDLTPEAFMVDRAKQDALSKLVTIDGLLDQKISAHIFYNKVLNIIRPDDDVPDNGVTEYAG